MNPLLLLPLLGGATGAGLGMIEGGDDIWKNALLGAGIGGLGAVALPAAPAGATLPGVPAGLTGVGGSTLGELGLGSTAGMASPMLGGTSGLSGVPAGLGLGVGPSEASPLGLGMGKGGTDKLLELLKNYKSLSQSQEGDAKQQFPPPAEQPVPKIAPYKSMYKDKYKDITNPLQQSMQQLIAALTRG